MWIVILRLIDSPVGDRHLSITTCLYLVAKMHSDPGILRKLPPPALALPVMIIGVDGSVTTPAMSLAVLESAAVGRKTP